MSATLAFRVSLMRIGATSLAISTSAASSASIHSFSVQRLINVSCCLTNASVARGFSTTSPQHTKLVMAHRLPADLIPPYPYGERQIYKQSNRGLYGKARIRFGNIVAEKHENKSRRNWKPNIHIKTFLMPSLGARVKTRLTLRVLKTIRREGGIENYLLKSKHARIKDLGPGGWNLRWLLIQSQAVQQRFNDERVILGLEPKELEDRDEIIQFALDFATPGPLSLRSRATLAEMQTIDDGTFVLGNDESVDVGDIQELTDEEEELLLRQVEEAEQERLEDKSPKGV